MPDTEELSDYFEWIKHAYERKVRAYIGWHNPGLTRTNIDDLVHETLQDALKRCWRHPEKLADLNLGGLLKTIAKRKTCDFYKKPVVATTGVDLDVSNRGYGDEPSDLHTDPAERKEIASLIAEAFQTMTEQEKRVWCAYCTNFPESRKYTKLAEFAEMPGQPRKAKNLLNTARAKIIQHLKSKGYNLD